MLQKQNMYVRDAEEWGGRLRSLSCLWNPHCWYGLVSNAQIFNRMYHQVSLRWRHSSAQQTRKLTSFCLHGAHSNSLLTSVLQNPKSDETVLQCMLRTKFRMSHSFLFGILKEGGRCRADAAGCVIIPSVIVSLSRISDAILSAQPIDNRVWKHGSKTWAGVAT